MKLFFRSVFFALSGILELLRSERNFKIHLLALIVVIIGGLYFHISSIEWSIVLLVSALVISLEAINTAIEKLCDLYTSEPNEKIKLIKDVAAAAVLIASIFAVVIACFIFGKYV
ncbi:MAG: diacylglycerol kinase family protein [Crocinitomicaceae bacterium]|nr:diacylglycerol kinase family protein [Crocinitomicaceae bacterium]MCF8434988.1 diacylglycerol kinase family protein [Crocinitomicaceae bacterium]